MAEHGVCVGQDGERRQERAEQSGARQREGCGGGEGRDYQEDGELQSSNFWSGAVSSDNQVPVVSSGQRGAKVKALRDQGWERLMDMDAEITRHNQSVEEASWRLPLLQPRG